LRVGSFWQKVKLLIDIEPFYLIVKASQRKKERDREIDTAAHKFTQKMKKFNTPECDQENTKKKE
jgi:hypothetical protein